MGDDYRSVLLRWPAAFKRIGQRSFVQDFGAAIYMVNRLVAAGASSVVTDNQIFTSADMLDRLPPIVRKRNFVVDTAEADAPGVSVIRRTKAEPPLVIGFPIDQARRSLDFLFRHSRDLNARANIATQAGIFQSYIPLSINGLEMMSGMSSENAQRVSDLLEDEMCRKLSSAGWRIGVPARVDRAVDIFSRCTRHIAESRAFKPLANLTSKTISTAVHLPLPDSNVGALIAKTGYMPPIIPVR